MIRPLALVASVALVALVALGASRASAAPGVAANDVVARVRAAGVVRCGAIVRPGIAVPTVDGKRWYGIAPDVCRAIAAAVLGDPARVAFRPYPDATGVRRAPVADDVVFASGAELIARLARDQSTLVLGPVVVHDSLALLVRADSGIASARELANKRVCVEPGTPADRALIRFFERASIPLREHPFQESDEMREAYATGNCDALAGPLTTLASVRADPDEGHPADTVLPEVLADDPVFAATPADARWSRIVWWAFSALVDAEAAGIAGAQARTATAIPGVPPAVGGELGLGPGWAQRAVAAGGNYGEIFERDLGARSRFRLTRGRNALSSDGGTIFGLHVE